ncbi:MAG: V-type ATPase 116kDa subunit family protein, partial [Methanobacteriota archaeon]
MFKAAKMKKFRALFSHRVHDDVIAGLHEVGVVQLKEISELELARKAADEEIRELSSLLVRFKELEEFIGRPIRKQLPVKKLTFAQTIKLAKKSLDKLEPRINLLKNWRDDFDREHQNLIAQIEMLEKFRAIKLPLKHLVSTDEIKIVVGYIDEDKVNEFISAAKEYLAQRVFTSVLVAGKQQVVIIACRTKDGEKLSPLLYRYEMKLLDIPPFAGSPHDAIKILEKKLAVVEKKQMKLGLDLKKLARAKAREISQMREILEIQRERLECTGLFGYTEATTVVEGWVKAKQTADLEKLLTSITQEHYILRTYDPQPADIKTVPIELENPKVLNNFEYITSMYGLPKYDEIDPTPFLTFTFALFFGICLSDAGYGVVLGLFMASGVWFAKAFPLKIRRLMVVCAVFTVFAGIMIGGWFGFGQPLWTNPIQRPIPLLKLVIFLGILHVLSGIGLAGILKDIYKRNWKGIIFNRVARILIIVGFFGLSFSIL